VGTAVTSLSTEHIDRYTIWRGRSPVHANVNDTVTVHANTTTPSVVPTVGSCSVPVCRVCFLFQLVIISMLRNILYHFVHVRYKPSISSSSSLSSTEANNNSGGPRCRVTVGVVVRGCCCCCCYCCWRTPPASSSSCSLRCRISSSSKCGRNMRMRCCLFWCIVLSVNGTDPKFRLHRLATVAYTCDSNTKNENNNNNKTRNESNTILVLHCHQTSLHTR